MEWAAGAPGSATPGEDYAACSDVSAHHRCREDSGDAGSEDGGRPADETAGDEHAAGVSPGQVDFDVSYGLEGGYEGTGLQTIYGGLSLAGPHSHSVRLGGRIELGACVHLSVEGECMTRGSAADYQGAFYGPLGW